MTALVIQRQTNLLAADVDPRETNEDAIGHDHDVFDKRRSDLPDNRALGGLDEK